MDIALTQSPNRKSQMPQNLNTTSSTFQLFKHHFYILRITYSFDYLIRFAEKNGLEETVYFKRVDVNDPTLKKLESCTQDTTYTPIPFNGVKYNIFRLQESLGQPIKGYKLQKIDRNRPADSMTDVFYYICVKVERR